MTCPCKWIMISFKASLAISVSVSQNNRSKDAIRRLILTITMRERVSEAPEVTIVLTADNVFSTIQR